MYVAEVREARKAILVPVMTMTTMTVLTCTEVYYNQPWISIRVTTGSYLVNG